MSGPATMLGNIDAITDRVSSAVAAVFLDADFSRKTARGDNAKKGPRTIQPAYFLKFSIDDGVYCPTSITYPSGSRM
jgi:hypothetical protein